MKSFLYFKRRMCIPGIRDTKWSTACIYLLTVFSFANAGPSENQEKESEAYANIPLGRLIGFQVPISHTSKNANVFLGVPYAKPPVGKLRFEKPVEIERWQGDREAKKFALQCIQMLSKAMKNRAEFSEDCLYLNIMAPSWTPSNVTGFPVLLFIHGGGFRFGGTAKLGYQYFVENYVNRDIIIVTIQHRLGLFGFSTFDEESFSGNYGLWDAHAALKFISDNIKYFKGDPQQITMWGHSAGSSIVGFLTVSEHAKGLFSRSIHMSGSPLGEWSCSESVANDTVKLAIASGCAVNSNMKSCLKGKTTDELTSAAESCVLNGDAITSLRFTVSCSRNAGYHSSGVDFVNAIKLLPPKSAMFGFTQNEALFHTLFHHRTAGNDFSIPLDEFDSFDESKFKSYVRKFLMNEKPSGERWEELAERIFDYYLGYGKSENGSPTQRNNEFYLRQHGQVISDFKFIVPLLIEARLKLLNGWKIIMYQFAYVNETNLPDWIPVKMAAHCSELPFVTGEHALYKSPVSGDADTRVKSTFIDAIVHFIQHGEMPAEQKWPPLTSPHPSVHMRISEEPKVVGESADLDRRLKFWANAAADLNVALIHDAKQFAEFAREEL